MQLLNLGCGATRPGHPWTNVDQLIASDFPKGTKGYEVLKAEENYIEADITQRLPFIANSFDGVLLSHVLEHFDARGGLALLLECKRVLKPGGTLLISVPDASYFRAVLPEDKNENWPRLFGVTDPKNPIPTFHEAALWFDQHLAILTEDALWCYFARAGFAPEQVERLDDHLICDLAEYSASRMPVNLPNWEALSAMTKQLNRLEFSLVMAAQKPASS